MTTGAECMNCGAALTGRYCSACGQKADVSIPSLGRFLADAFGDLYSFDSRFWRSLLTLAFKPGRLTRYYLEGRRERYMPPFRMYIVTSIVFFLVFSLLRPEPAPDAVPSADANAAAAVPTRALEVDLSADQQGQEQRPDRRAFGRAYAENIPVTMLVLIPFIAAIMKLLFLFARRKYVEHLVFFFHVHTFFFVTLTATFLMARAAAVPWLGVPAAIFGWTAWLYFLAYLYLAMRHVYEQGYVLTTVKYVVLGVSYLTAFLVAVAGLFVAVLITR